MLKKYLDKILPALLLVLSLVAVWLPLSPLFQAIFGTILLYILPGWLVLRILRLNYLDFFRRLVLSVGISTAVIMGWGRLMNGLLPMIGELEPLSREPLVLSFGSLCTVLVILDSLRFRPLECRFSSHSILPIFSVCLGLALLIPYALTLDLKAGGDIILEYRIYESTLRHSHWTHMDIRTLDSCLSISLLPAITQKVLGIDPLVTFQLFSVFLTSLLPLTVFLASERWVGQKLALPSALFIAVQVYFLHTTSYARTNIAVLFSSLLVLLVIDPTIRLRDKVLLGIVLSGGLVVSHYGVTFVTLFLLLGWIIASLVGEYLGKANLGVSLGSLLVVCLVPLIALSFVWHGLVSERTATENRLLQQGASFIRYSLQVEFTKDNTPPIFLEGSSLLEDDGSTPKKGALLDLRSREVNVQSALWPHWPSMNAGQRVEWIITWISVGLFSLGLLIALIKKRDSQTFLALSAYGLIVTAVVLPHISVWYGLARVYFHMVVFLGPMYALGSEYISSKLKLPSGLLTYTVLAILGLSTSGIIHILFGVVR